MNRLVLLVGVLLAAIGGAAWWVLAARGPDAGAAVRIEWRGSHTGAANLPGEVAWCPVNRMGTLLAISNDTGLLVTLAEPDSLAPAPHPVVAPASRDQAPRPSAIASLRWAGDSGLLRGFQSVSGLLDLRTVGTRVSGSLEMRMRAPVGPDTLVVTASFADLPVVASAVGCP